MVHSGRIVPQWEGAQAFNIAGLAFAQFSLKEGTSPSALL